MPRDKLQQGTSYKGAQGTPKGRLRQGAGYDNARVTKRHELRQGPGSAKGQVTVPHLKVVYSCFLVILLNYISFACRTVLVSYSLLYKNQFSSLKICLI